jgi:hypothetical protein
VGRVDLDERPTQTQWLDLACCRSEAVDQGRVDHITMDRMARLAVAGCRSLLREDGVAAAEHLRAPLELLHSSSSSFSAPPTFGDGSREGVRKPEDHLGRCVPHAVRPELVAQPEDICECLFDVVQAEQWKL